MAAPNPAVCFLYRGQKLVQQPIDHRNLSMSFARGAENDRPFCSHFYTAPIVLPRQARDKHREALKTEAFFRRRRGVY